jgi:hypothetical protein
MCLAIDGSFDGFPHISRPQAPIPGIADVPARIPINFGAGLTMRIRLCDSAKISVTHLTFADPLRLAFTADPRVQQLA